MVRQSNDVGARSSDDAAERDERARVSSREALRFLTRAGRVLSASLEPDQTLRRLMRLAIPRVACFAAIDLLREDGCLERLAHGHIEDGRDRLLEEPDPFGPEDCFPPIGQALASRRSILIEDTTRNWQVDPVTQQRMIELGGRSAIIVPLLAHDRILGVITLGSTRTDRHYDRQDLSLAEELARTAALALENARLYQRAEQAISARDEVLAVVSHDLRNPVNRVRMAAELILERDDAAPETERMAGIVIRAADEMNRLIGDLLDVARIEAGRLSIERTPADMAALLDRLDESHAAAAIEKTLRWTVRHPPQTVVIEIDEGRILQALGNLVGNAFKFTPAGGAVEVGVEECVDVIRVVVSDTGPGMTAEQLAHVFDRFWQARQGDRGGAGLGLAIARGIVEAHGGTLQMKSEPGNGTRAIVELPRSQEVQSRGMT